MAATSIWIVSCILLGVIWIVGPLLNLFVNKNGQSTLMTSQAIQWIFALVIELKGVWMLIDNIYFYLRNQTRMEYYLAHSLKDRRIWYYTDEFGISSAEMDDDNLERKFILLKNSKNQLVKKDGGRFVRCRKCKI